MFRYIVPFRQINSAILTSATQSKSQSSVKQRTSLAEISISGEDKKEQVEIQTLNEGALIVDFYI